MNKRPIDRSKKSNIKCEHCLYCDKPTEYWKNYHCCLHVKEVNYWNRCKDFKWAEKDAVVAKPELPGIKTDEIIYDEWVGDPEMKKQLLEKVMKNETYN